MQTRFTRKALCVALASLCSTTATQLLADETGEPVGHPHTALIFEGFDHGAYKLKPRNAH